jgi:hypothetical protein
MKYEVLTITHRLFKGIVELRFTNTFKLTFNGVSKKIILSALALCSFSVVSMAQKPMDKDEKLNFETYFMPGGGYSYFMPKGVDSVGNWSGVTIDYLFYAKVEQDDDPGPSHVRWYGKLSIMNSDKEGMKDMFLYSAGVDLSLEKNPTRNFLVPYFGLEFGGVSQKQLGSTVQFTPTVGLHILSHQNLFINVYGGYNYPIKNFDLLQGWYAQAGLNFALW